MENCNVKLAAGVIIQKQDKLLIVRDRKRWGLPKGGHELGETLKETARREAKEETGLEVSVKDLAFITEFHKEDWGHYLQLYFYAEVVGGALRVDDPDGDILEVQYISSNEILSYISFRPIAVPLSFIKAKESRSHYIFNLDQEPLEL
ncbi:ADP-ribose pyrophosphatase YjhB (NUDIX family) [Pullulanibacillus pueri]|uniref:Nudix hydrolase domain-containing protein n=1 Tax=Pullulanibacillus pueri TaxID=1437324 RepID=A0A8J2ZS36_9BACL|nr:NUDIX hydrolase [Pullulanibacillus pueri]MBM7680417.1 ADP-ribose pyrophosphatase YjhB (NUDIX family) [Pullulanibacillus pueri]GGH75190.1 hypothetical protein GCM10007096_04150 [Pullulanibacillus pueri]